MERLQNKRILITGAGGFIGSHVVRTAIDESARVCAVSHTSTPWRLDEYGSAIERATLSLPGPADMLLTSFKPDVVVHLAGVTNRATSSTEQLRAVNTKGVKDIFQAAVACPSVQQFVTLGSKSEYGDKQSPITEETQCDPLDDYGRSKLAATEFLHHAVHTVRFKTTVLRPCAAYGESQNIGMFIPDCIHACLTRTPIPLSPSEQQLDFVYIGDLATAILEACERTHGEQFEIINIGSGHAESLKDVGTMIADELNAHEYLQFGARKYQPHEPFTRFLSTRKAKDILGWTAATDTESGLKKTIAWYKAHKELLPRLVV